MADIATAGMCLTLLIAAPVLLFLVFRSPALPKPEMTKQELNRGLTDSCLALVILAVLFVILAAYVGTL